MRTELNAIGCSVYGVAVAAISATDLQALRQLLYANRLIVLKQQALSEQQYCDFAKAFISPSPDMHACCHHPQHSLITVGCGHAKDAWRSEASYEKVPKVVTLLMPRSLPMTSAYGMRFIDMAEVCAELPKSISDHLAGVPLLHGRRRRDGQMLDAGAPVCHPAVITHPHTREKILYANRSFTIGIAGSATARSAALLEQIFDLAESPRFVKEIRWSPGDLAIWDNRFLQHTSKPVLGPGEDVTLHRITGRDAYPLCASQLSGRAAA